MTTVLLTGTYNSCNKGDAAMELSAAEALRERVPGIEVRISSPFPEIDADFYRPTPVVTCDRRRLVSSTLNLARAWLWRALAASTGRSWRGLLPGGSAAATREADLVLDLSGDMLSEDSGVHVAYSHFIPLLRAIALDRPFAVCAQSIGPFRWTRPLARFVLSRARVITIRDEISRRQLAPLGIESDAVAPVADLSFLLMPAPVRRADEILRAEGIELPERPLVGVSLSPLIEARWRRASPVGRRTPLVAVVAAALRRFADASGASLLLVPHVTGPTRAKDDRETLRRLRAQLASGLEVHLIEGDHRPEELKALIGRCALFLGARMHANIAALSSAVPTVALGYSHKAPGIMAACGQHRFALSIASLGEDDLHTALAEAFGRREEIAAELRTRLPGLQAAARESIERVARLLGAGEEQAR